MQPYIQANLFAQDVTEQDVGKGLSDGQIGLQTRYEFTRQFAPYMDFHYGQKFGDTKTIAYNHTKNSDDYGGALGLRLMF